MRTHVDMLPARQTREMITPVCPAGNFFAWKLLHYCIWQKVSELKIPYDTVAAADFANSEYEASAKYCHPIDFL